MASIKNRDLGSMFDFNKLARDKKLDRMLRTVVKEVSQYAEEQIDRIRKSAEIGRALSREDNIDVLLELIMDEARAMSNADAGTLYILDKEKKSLSFRIFQNETLDIRIGGRKDKALMNFPNVPLYTDGSPNHTNVSSHVALTGKSINIGDVYKADGFDFTGPRNYDKETGYLSKSMLVISLTDHENKNIGVLQLLNAREPGSKTVISFSKEDVMLIESLASQAAIALTHTKLIKDLKAAIETIKNLFNAFIESIATAIDGKSHYTADHIRRVVEITMMIAEEINKADNGPFQNVHLNEHEMEELRLAAWMHDVGKIATPEYIVNKTSKLEGIFDRMPLIETRFQLIEKSLENEYLKKKIDLIEQKPAKQQAQFSVQESILRMETELSCNLKVIKKDLEFIRKSNQSREYMAEADVERIKNIAEKTFDIDGISHPFLKSDEVECLCIRKGNLSSRERDTIKEHANMTFKILEQLPFHQKLARVPEYAAGHHEHPDGSGYPRGLAGDKFPLQSRIMAIADIFEALTAKDRPYKKKMSLSRAMNILDKMKSDGHIDPDIYDLFKQAGIYHTYAQKRLDSEQIDL